jgi:hypothetical protein
MKEKDLLNIWQKGNELLETGQITHDQMKKLVKPRINQISVYVRFQLCTYLLAHLVSIVLSAFNMYGYRGNLTMQVISSALILCCIIFIYVGLALYQSFRRISQQNHDIISLLKERIVFFHYRFERWHYVAAASVWILTFALNTNIDNMDGLYRINKPFVFLGISIAMIVFIFVVNKSGAGMVLRQTMACLRGLESDWQDAEKDLAAIHKKQRRTTIISAVILIILFVIGMWVFLS